MPGCTAHERKGACRRPGRLSACASETVAKGMNREAGLVLASHVARCPILGERFGSGRLPLNMRAHHKQSL
jgi:hypothetical protein